MASKVVVTGGAGFVGKYLQQELPGAISWDRPEVDITDSSTYRNQLAELQPDWVIHLAALVSVGASWKDPAAFERVNVEGTRQLLEAIAGASPRTRVLAISTGDVYTELRSPYGQSKWEMEQLIDATFSDRCIVARPFPHIGPGQNKGFVTADFASQIAAIEAGTQEPVIKVGNLDAIRDFTDVRDVVRAYRLLLEKGTIGETYDIASGKGYTIKTILDMLLTMSRVNITIEADPDRQRPSDTPALVGDASKLRAATGWQPQIALKQTLQDILDAWRKAVLR